MSWYIHHAAEERMKETSVDETVGGEEGETADGASEPEEVGSTHEQGTEEGIDKVPEEATGGSGPRETVEDENHRKLRLRLERAIRSKNAAELEPAVEAVKKEKVPNCSELLNKVRATFQLWDVYYYELITGTVFRCSYLSYCEQVLYSFSLIYNK